MSVSRLLEGRFEYTHRRLQQLRSVSIDMREAYINAVSQVIDDAERLISFDEFLVAAHFGKAVGKVRAAVHRVLRRPGSSPLTRGKHDW